MSAGDIIYIFVVLLILLAGVYIVVYLMKKVMFRFDNSAAQNIPINLIAVQGIMPKKFVGIIKVKDDFYLIGISENNITLLDKLDPGKFDEFDFDYIQNSKFSDVLKKTFSKK